MVRKLKPRQSRAAASAEIAVEGVGHNVVTASEFSKCYYRDPDLTELMVAQGLANEAIQRGDLKAAEGLLNAQAVTLNAIFTTLAFQSRHSTLFDHMERYLRLALKAQSQCRATVETLALLKNPPIFARQANVASQQLVNNGTVVQPSRAEISKPRPNELLEAHGERLDGREESLAEQCDPALAAVGTLHRSSDP